MSVLNSSIFLFIQAVYYLFADAKFGEDFLEDLVGGDFAGDGAEAVEDFADVAGGHFGGGGGEA